MTAELPQCHLVCTRHLGVTQMAALLLLLPKANVQGSLVALRFPSI